MKIELTAAQVLDAVKPITRASVDDYAEAIRLVVTTWAKAFAYVYALGTHINELSRHPYRLLPSAEKPVVAVVDEPVSLPQALEIVNEREAVQAPSRPKPSRPAPTKPNPPVKRTTRTRKSKGFAAA